MALCFFFLVRGLLLSAVRFQIEREHVRENRVHGAGLISKGPMPTDDEGFSEKCSRKTMLQTYQQARAWKLDNGRKGNSYQSRTSLRMEQKLQMKQPSAVGHCNCLRPAQNIELFENSLNMTFDGDFSNGHRRADEFVGSAFRQQPQHL